MKNLKVKYLPKMVKNALKNGFKSKQKKGMMLLRDLPVGKIFKTESGTKGVLIEINTNAKVVILSGDWPEEDKGYYLGKQLISADTEIYNEL